MITRVSDVLAGVLLVNTLPHVVRGLGGKRGLTPFGEDFCRTCLIEEEQSVESFPEHSAPPTGDDGPEPAGTAT